MRIYTSRPLAEKFEEKVVRIPFSECWFWIANVDNLGRGRIMSGSKAAKTKRTELASRVAYQLFKGPIPAGLVVMHSCDNPACVNPYHLSAGTQKQNVADMLTKGRCRAGMHQVAQTHCKHGHEFTEENTEYDTYGHRACKECRRLMRRRYRASKKSTSTTAKEAATA